MLETAFGMIEMEPCFFFKGVGLRAASGKIILISVYPESISFSRGELIVCLEVVGAVQFDSRFGFLNLSRPTVTSIRIN